MQWDGKNVLLTGGTGSFGRKFSEVLLRDHKPRVLRIFSRDELKQTEMRALAWGSDPRLRYLIGDVRDETRLHRALDGINIVVHAAALKQVPSCEYNPFEAVRTNIHGAENVVNAALDNNVERVIGLSTDKAVNPVNLYGASKLCAEKIFVHGNSYAGERGTRCSVVRYGNVVGSRGSVIPVFHRQRSTGKLTLTDERMTRFWLSLEQAVNFVIRCGQMMHGGEVFVPRIPSMKITDLATAIAPDCKWETVGIRPGEKIHEVLVTEDEARHTLRLGDFYVIEPEHPWWQHEKWLEGTTCPAGFRYASDSNDQWLTREDLQRMVGDLP